MDPVGGTGAVGLDPSGNQPIHSSSSCTTMCSPGHVNCLAQGRDMGGWKDGVLCVHSHPAEAEKEYSLLLTTLSRTN